MQIGTECTFLILFLPGSEGRENKTKTPRLINHSRRDLGRTCAKYGHVCGKERMSEKGG